MQMRLPVIKYVYICMFIKWQKSDHFMLLEFFFFYCILKKKNQNF